MSDRLEAALIDVLARIECGDTPSADALRAQYPDLCEPILDVLALRGRLSDLAAADVAAPRASNLRIVETGRYERFRLLGEGGMGLVYWALDTELNREVAFKIVRPDGPAGDAGAPEQPVGVAPPPAGTPASAAFETLKARFLQEAWVTAGLEHPGIVPVYEVGTTRKGVPYYTMRFVRGSRTLTQAMNEAKARPADERLALLDPFLRVCDTMRYAHAHGVIHRDLKPDNVALGEFGEVVVLDWGIAKIRDRPDAAAETWKHRLDEFRDAADLRTKAGALGTPGYMSPEAAAGRIDEVDERSDVYSLGAVLYQLLTGKLPYDFRTYRELLDAMEDAAPVAPASLDAAIPRTVSAICLRALARERGERQQSVDALATEVRAWLAKRARDHEIEVLEREATVAMSALADLQGEALLRQLDRVHAAATKLLDRAPESETARGLLSEAERRREMGIRQRERAARRRIVRRTAVVGLAVALVGTGSAAWVVRSERDLKDDALRAGRALALVNASKAAQPADPMRALLLAREATRLAVSPATVSQLHGALAASLEMQVLRGHASSVVAAVFSPSEEFGKLVLTASADHTARIWNLDSGSSVLLAGHHRALTCAVFSPRAPRVLTGSADGTARLWGLDGSPIRSMDAPPGDAVSAVAYSPRGERMLIGYADGTVQLRDAQGELIRTLDGHTGRITAVLFGPQLSPMADRIATASEDGDVRVWDGAGDAVETLPHDGKPVLAMAFAPTTASLLTGCSDRCHRVWDLAASRAKPLSEETLESSAVASVAYSPKGDRFVTGLADGTARLWESGAEKAMVVLQGHTGVVSGVAFSPNGELVAICGGADATARVFDRQGQLVASFTGHGAAVHCVQFAADSQRVLSASGDGTARIWGVKGIEVSTTRSLPWGEHPFAVTGIGAECIVAVPARGKAVLQPRNGGEIRYFGDDGDELRSARFSRGGKRVVTANSNGRVRVYSTDDGRSPTADFMAHDVGCRAEFSPDGKQILTWSDDDTAALWDAASPKRPLKFVGHEGPILSAAFTEDGLRIATGSSDRMARVWDAATGKCRPPLGPNAGAVRSVAFAHRSDDLLVAAGRTAQIWRSDGRAGLAFPHDSPALVAAFTFDDTIVAVGCGDGSVWLWDAVTGAEIARLPGHSAGVVDVEFMSDGSTLCSACGDGNVRERYVRAQDTIEFADRKIARAFTPDSLANYLALMECGRDELLAAYEYVEPKMAKDVLVADVAAEVRADARIGERERAVALQVLERTYDDPEYVRERAWTVVSEGGRAPAAYRDALRWAEAADDLRHEGPEFRVVLGVAQHRAGDEAAALRTLREVDSTLGEKGTGTHLVCVAASALVHHATVDDGAARDDLARLDRLAAIASEPVPRQDALLDEAHALRRELGSGR